MPKCQEAEEGQEVNTGMEYVIIIFIAYVFNYASVRMRKRGIPGGCKISERGQGKVASAKREPNF